MLNSAYIVNLEDRWKRWKTKRFLKLFFASVLFFSIFLSGWYGYLFLMKSNTSLIKNEPPTLSNKKNENLEKKQTKSPSKIDTPLPQPKSKQPELSIKTLPPSQKIVSSGKSVAIPKTETISLESSEDDKSITENPTKKSEVEVVAPLEEKAKIHIDIQPANSNSTKYLKEKFDATGNVVFALMIADEYYSLEEYKDALRWALTANEMDPKNERSWILFAMSKAKLNQPKEAIMALEEYLKINNSGKIESLLINLKRGTF